MQALVPRSLLPNVESCSEFHKHPWAHPAAINSKESHKQNMARDAL